MIPSVDTYVYKTVNSFLEYILSDKYILDIALKNIDEEAKEHFIKTYGGNNPKKNIDITYVFPGFKEQFDARIVVQLGASKMANESLGGVEGTFQARELGYEVEQSVVEPHPDPARNDILQIAIQGYTKNTSDVIVEDIEFARGDNFKAEGNILTFKRYDNEHLIGKQVKVMYHNTKEYEDGGDPVGSNKGYTSNDSVELFLVSKNMNTLRCLDAIVKVILILMKDTTEENTTYLLGMYNFGSTENLTDNGNYGDSNTVLYTRSIDINYTVTNHIDNDYQQIKEFIFRKKGV